jgi:hypothetical protein
MEAHLLRNFFVDIFRPPERPQPPDEIPQPSHSLALLAGSEILREDIERALRQVRLALGHKRLLFASRGETMPQAPLEGQGNIVVGASRLVRQAAKDSGSVILDARGDTVL